MVHNMNTELTKKIPNSFAAYPAMISLMIYVFFYQFDYPFGATVFLYVAFALSALWMILGGGMYISVQAILAAALVVVSAVGTFYTSNSEKGDREAILMAVTCVFLVFFSQNDRLLSKIKKITCILSFTVLAGVLIQYMFPDAINAFLENVLKEDCFEEMIRAYNNDRAYAGFSSLTSDASYFSAIVLGYSAFDMAFNEKSTLFARVIGVVFIALAVFAVILTSKRGVAVAMIIAFFFSVMVKKRMSTKMVLGVIALIIVGTVALYVLSLHSESVSAFFERFEAVNGQDITTGRIEIWQNAIKNLKNIFFGMGTGSAYDIYDTGLHNIYLQIFYDHGLFGFVVYLAFFVSNLLMAIRRHDDMSIFVQTLLLSYGMSGNPIYSNSFFIAYIIFSTVATDASTDGVERLEK